MSNWIKRGSGVIWHGGRGAQCLVEAGILIDYSSDGGTVSNCMGGVYTGGWMANVQAGSDIQRLPITAIRKDTPLNRQKMEAKALIITAARIKRLALK